MQTSFSCGLQISGIAIDIVKVLAKHLGFRPTFQPAQAWGFLLPNNTLSGTEGNVSIMYMLQQV